MYNITGDTGINLCKKVEVFRNFTEFLMASELQVLVLVRMAVNVPLMPASLVRITRTATSTHTGVTVNAA